MLDKLLKIFSSVTGESTGNITPKTKLKDLKGMTSFGIIRIICEIEDEFDISIENKAVKGFKTVADVMKYIEKKCNKK